MIAGSIVRFREAQQCCIGIPEVRKGEEVGGYSMVSVTAHLHKGDIAECDQKSSILRSF